MCFLHRIVLPISVVLFLGGCFLETKEFILKGENISLPVGENYASENGDRDVLLIEKHSSGQFLIKYKNISANKMVQAVRFQSNYCAAAHSEEAFIKFNLDYVIKKYANKDKDKPSEEEFEKGKQEYMEEMRTFYRKESANIKKACSEKAIEKLAHRSLREAIYEKVFLVKGADIKTKHPGRWFLVQVSEILEENGLPEHFEIEFLVFEPEITVNSLIVGRYLDKKLTLFETVDCDKYFANANKSSGEAKGKDSGILQYERNPKTTTEDIVKLFGRCVDDERNRMNSNSFKPLF